MQSDRSCDRYLWMNLYIPARRNMANWEDFSHGSDIGVRGIESSVEEAFEQATIALTAVVADVATTTKKLAKFVAMLRTLDSCWSVGLTQLFMKWRPENAVQQSVTSEIPRRTRFRCWLSEVHSLDRVQSKPALIPHSEALENQLLRRANPWH